MEKIRFRTEFVTESDDAVVCIVTITNAPWVCDDIWRGYTHLMGDYPDYKIKIRYKGVAVRKSDDESDIATAKEIARKKALRSAYRDIKNYAVFMQKDICKRVEDFAGQIDRLKKKADTLDEEIKDIVATWKE